jgi:hypothetical protein
VEHYVRRGAVVCYNAAMKKILFIAVLLFPVLAWAEPSIEFQEEKHDFGCISEGEQVEFTFVFSNTGSNDLIIKDIKTS